MYVCVYVCMHVCMYVIRMYVCIYVIRVCVCVCVVLGSCVCACVYSQLTIDGGFPCAGLEAKEFDRASIG